MKTKDQIKPKYLVLRFGFLSELINEVNKYLGNGWEC